jgi:hypothetical protein
MFYTLLKNGSIGKTSGTAMRIIDCDYLVLGSGIAGLMSALHLSRHGRVLVVTKKGDQDVEKLTDNEIPMRLGPKRASKIRKLFALDKADDLTKFQVKRTYETKKGKSKTKKAKIQRLVTPITLQVHGYDNLNIHSAIAKSVYASNSGMKQNYVISTNILWSIQVVCEPFERTYFSNMNTAGKVSYFMPIVEDIEIYFTDDWGDIITDVFDWQIMLTFDFVLPDPFPEPDTIKRARMKHLTA